MRVINDISSADNREGDSGAEGPSIAPVRVVHVHCQGQAGLRGRSVRLLCVRRSAFAWFLVIMFDAVVHVVLLNISDVVLLLIQCWCRVPLVVAISLMLLTVLPFIDMY
jgi:hypothetical protein